MDLREKGWLYYSDSWHPFWRAEVNGKPTQVYAANMGYKAIALEPGHNEVRFEFYSSILRWAHFLLSLQGIGWCVFFCSEC